MNEKGRGYDIKIKIINNCGNIIFFKKKLNTYGTVLLKRKETISGFTTIFTPNFIFLLDYLDQLLDRAGK